jgi:hypothetical protein
MKLTDRLFVAWLHRMAKRNVKETAMGRITAMTPYRDMVLIACDDGSIWQAWWSDYDQQMRFACIITHLPR